MGNVLEILLLMRLGIEENKGVTVHHTILFFRRQITCEASPVHSSGEVKGILGKERLKIAEASPVSALVISLSISTAAATCFRSTLLNADSLLRKMTFSCVPVILGGLIVGL